MQFKMRLAVAAGGCLLVLTGCTVFEPREATPPSSDESGTPYRPPNDASGIFNNLKSGVENLAQGENYDRSLSDLFVFLPRDADAIDPSLPPGIYDGWTKPVEMEVLQLMISESKAATLTFNRSELLNEQDFVQFEVTYELRLTAKADNTESVYKGVAIFDVRRVGGIWLLERWKDNEEIDGFTTWGFLKGTLRAKLGG